MTPLVLIPGMMCDERLFLPQVAAYSKSRQVICAPIYARSTINELAQDILAEAPQRFALAGLSMGGIVAMEILRLAPDRIERIALLDTNPLAETAEIKARRYPQMKVVSDGGLVTVIRDEMKPNYLSDSPQRIDILNLCLEMALDLGPAVFLNQSRALMNRVDQSATLQSANLPALILCGREDKLCPVARHELMAKLMRGSHLEIIEGAAHLPTLEQPELTNAALSRWLESE